MGDLFSEPMLLGEGIGLAVVVWVWLGLLAPALSKRTGVAMEEPPVPLYGSVFKGLQGFLLTVLLILGIVFQPKSDIVPALTERGLALGLALVNVALIGGALVGLAALYVSWERQRQSVVIESGSGGVAVKILIAILIIGVLAGAPWAADEFLGVDLITMLFGGAGSGSGTGMRADLGSFVGLLVLGVAFWLVPETLARREEARDNPGANYQTSGLELFRWTWLGVVLIAVTGIAAGIPGLDAAFAYPLSPLTAALVALTGVVIYVLFWGLPLRAVAARAADGDYLANELLAQARFAGLPALLTHNKHATGVKSAADDETKLCPTCLRPISDINAYKDFKFDKCPHCASFIPPVFTMMDYVKSQSARLTDLMEEPNLPPGSKPVKKKARGVDENQLVQDLLKGILALTIAERGTDVHLVVEEELLRARVRLDGVLYTLVEFDKVMARPLISTAKVLADMDITERRKPQDGSFKIQIGGKGLDVRINTSPVADGETAAMRLLYPQEEYMSLNRLGMSARNLTAVEKSLASPSGLLLVTGPTGSGKSTTLYNGLRSMCDGRRNIITLEDPIEVEINGITQMQINPSKNFTFATGLRTILRQDPDVIMVGEIRDSETAKMAVDAASTGHLVMSTLHSTDAIAVISRMTDLGVDPKRVADVCLLYIAQRLIRINCDRCSEDVMVTREQMAGLGIPGAPAPQFAMRRGRGCEHCHNSGFRTREGIHEFFVPDENLRQMVGSDESAGALRNAARAAGMRTLLEDGMVKALLGRTTIEELARVTS